MNIIQKPTYFRRIIPTLSLALILSLLFSACGSTEPPKGALAYLENAVLPHTPFKASDAEVVETLLNEIYICEGDICAFRSPGLVDGLFPKMDQLLYLYLLAEESGLNDDSLMTSVKSLVRCGLREMDSFSLSDAAAVLGLEKLILKRDNGERIETWLQEHAEKKTGLLARPGSTFDENGPSGDALGFMIMDTGKVIDLFNQCGISVDSDSFHAGVQQYLDTYTFKLPAEGDDMFKSGGDALYDMPLLGIDVSPYTFWWEAWQDTFLNKTIENDSDLNDILGWIRIANSFSDDTLQKKLNDYLRNTDLSRLLENTEPDHLYNLLHGMIGGFPAEKKEAIGDFCRRRVKRYEEVLLAPTLRDSFYGASLAKASGFSVEWEKLLSCCGAMLEKEQSSDYDTNNLLHYYYYFAMLSELLKSDVKESSYESALSLLEKFVKESMKKISYEDVTGMALLELSEVQIALGISKDRKHVQKLQSEYDYWMNDIYEGKDIKNDSLYVNYLYRIDSSCGLNKISTEDLQEMLSNLAIDGLYAFNSYDRYVADLETSFWVYCLRTRHEALHFTADELSSLSEQAALHFGDAMESPDLANIFYYLCLKYCVSQTTGGTP